MANTYYDRYKAFRTDGLVEHPVPFIGISRTATDVTVLFDKKTMRMDTLSYKYYNSPDYAWLIFQANPDVSSFEFLIENGTELRIPYPLDSALARYERAVQQYKEQH